MSKTRPVAENVTLVARKEDTVHNVIRLGIGVSDISPGYLIIYKCTIRLRSLSLSLVVAVVVLNRRNVTKGPLRSQMYFLRPTIGRLMR